MSVERHWYNAETHRVHTDACRYKSGLPWPQFGNHSWSRPIPCRVCLPDGLPPRA